jgi:hypothetical protein
VYSNLKCLVPYVNKNVSYYLWWVEGVGEGHLQVEEEVASLVGAAHRATYRGLKKTGEFNTESFNFTYCNCTYPIIPAYSRCGHIPQLLDN